MSCIYNLKKFQTEVNIGGHSQRLMLVCGKLLTMKSWLNIIKLSCTPIFFRHCGSTQLVMTPHLLCSFKPDPTQLTLYAFVALGHDRSGQMI